MLPQMQNSHIKWTLLLRILHRPIIIKIKMSIIFYDEEVYFEKFSWRFDR